MSEKELAIRLIAKDEISKAFKKIERSAGKTENAFEKFGSGAKKAIEMVSHSLNILRETFNIVGAVVRGFWDQFIKPAVQARKLTASLTNVFGGGVAERIKSFSKDTGLAFEAISKGALDASKNIERAGGMDAYLKAVERVSKWRPDLGAEGAVAFVNDLIGKVAEVTEGSGKQLGRYTSVVVGGTAAQALDLSKELDKLGVINRVVDPALTAFGKLRDAWDQFKATVGEAVLDKLAEGALKLVTYLQDNEAALLKLTGAFTDLINNALQKFIDWIDDDGMDRFVAGIDNAVGGVQELARVFAPVLGFLQKIQPLLDVVTRPESMIGNFMGSGGKRLTGRKGGGGIGGLFGSARKAAGPFAGKRAADVASRQTVDVTVSVDDSGAIQAYTTKQINRNNAELVSGGNQNLRTVGAGAMR